MRDEDGHLPFAFALITIAWDDDDKDDDDDDDEDDDEDDEDGHLPPPLH